MNPDYIKTPDEFDPSIGEKLGPMVSSKYFKSDPEVVTPTLDWYDDDNENQTHMNYVDDITPEAIDNYIGGEIMISHGDKVAQGRFRRRKRDVEGNTIVRANNNHIIDTRTYEVEFEDGSMSTYSEDVISESIYSHCDEEGQKYLLF